ncbi:M56 family metallopeptidase [Nocardia amikacinitolerans]|uniref:M56 family metallopeptidase n=1 Tax=Nocardia amikacinitolerans TaxID=756689 RepID=UPI0020A5AA61|nr:M56 family metallopeptidase [Nocardia amikacinitolerans]MCP2276011.1 Zn-dependent protease with chaperone function [Nocardia amikacinitolerans]
MNVALCLMAYGSTVSVFGPPVLHRLTRRGVAPRLGVLAWLVAIAGALGAWVLAAGLLVVEFATYWRHPSEALRACYSVLSFPLHPHGWAAQLATYSLAAVLASGVAAVSSQAAQVALRLRRRTFAHGRAVRMVGRELPGVGAVVLDSPEPQAYCVAGRPETIVVTSAALDALTRDQLAAVLAHEHAHLRGRHAALTATLRAMATTLPGLRLLTEGSVEIGRLLEMCADDRAARVHGREPLLGGLLALVGAGAPLPVGALGAAGTAVLARAERLVDPVRGVHRATNRTALLGVIAATVIGLFEIAVGILFCSTMIN